MQPTPALRATVLAALTLAAPAVFATNGMNMEGYGPVSTGMGGAATAFDNGTGAMAGNPATLSLMGEGSRAEVALGILGPKVSTSMGGMVAKSGGSSYFMPAVGWTRTQDGLTYGVGMFAQGGMGTEYDANSMLAMGTGDDVRSELGVGRVIFPLSMKVNDRLTVGGSLDLVWSGLDIKMALPAAQLPGLVTGGSLATALPPSGFTAARVDFSNNNDFTGQANSTGWGAKLGMTYLVDSSLRAGASYQLKTRLGDMKTGQTGATLSIMNGPTALMAMPGMMTVNDFQWPATTALGVAWIASPKLMVAADIKHLAWKDVMKNFSMTFSNSMGDLSFALPQNWKNQTVLMLGMAYKTTDALTLRGGLNLASNPVPDATVNPIFPATVKNHVTFGAGYAFDKQSSVQASYTVAPTVTVTSGSGAVISHSQRNLQLMYSTSY